MRGDGQEPDIRCDVFETSGHVTTKSSICTWDTFYKFGVYAMTVLCLTPGDLLCALEFRERMKLAEPKVTLVDRIGEVSRRHSSDSNR